MTRPRAPIVAGAFAALLGVLSLAACSSSDDAVAAATSAPARATSTAAPADAAPGISDLRGARYCEVLLLRRGAKGFSAEVWNTIGLSDCPADRWAALDAEQIATERDAVAAVLNGPRYWTLDSITTDQRSGAPETAFGGISMFQAATVELGDQLPRQTPYTERAVARETVFGFDAGSEVYELIAPDGTTYVMQSWSQIVDPDLDEADLPGLGERLELPPGWEYRVRTLAEPLDVLSTDGVATVVQDELQDSYQRIDGPSGPGQEDDG